MTVVQHALLALHEEWCGEGGTHFLVELGLRASVAAPLREGHAAAVNTVQTHTGHAVSTHFGGHNLSVHSTQTNSLVVTSEWELLLSQPHSPSQHSLPTTHCTLHACTPLSAASHMTTLLGGRRLGVVCGVICRGCSPLHSPTAEWRPQGGRRPPHSLCSPRTIPTRVDQYRRTPHSNWYVCMCVLCVWTTGASLAVTTHRVVAVWG